MIFKSNLSKNIIFIRLLFLFSLNGLLFSQLINGFVREESSGEPGEYSNALLNSATTKGRSIGIDGGFGVFGAIASDWKFLKIIKD